MAKTVSGLVIGLAACLLLGPGRADPPKPAEPPREGDARKEVKKRNLDAAALNYVDMTLLCVKCHKHVREVRRTRLVPPDPANARQAVKHSGD